MSDDSVSLTPLDRPAEGIPAVIDDPRALQATIAALLDGHGDIAVDAERAQGFRYGAEAYLIQIRREGAGTHLIDPRAFTGANGTPDLRQLNGAMSGATWVLHAASQDLACLADAGLRPTRLFDTELAARLAHRDRVGLGPILEEEFGVHLRKEHSAADWSQRPLPQDWLNYAALDVELLIPLAARMRDVLSEQGKLDWAREEFEALVQGIDDAKPERIDPWRRTHGLPGVRTQAGLALVRELWVTRDELARRLDKGPSRILPDQAIVDLAATVDATRATWPGRDDLRRIEGFRRRNAQRYEANWLAAIERARALPKQQWPPKRLSQAGPSAQPRNWARHHPEAYDRWLAVRPAVNDRADELDLPPENLLSPAALRAVAWQPEGTDAASVEQQLRSLGARAWQAKNTAACIADALVAGAPSP